MAGVGGMGRRGVSVGDNHPVTKGGVRPSVVTVTPH